MKAKDAMTRPVSSLAASAFEAVRIMLRKSRELLGIATRENLMGVPVCTAKELPTQSTSDAIIRERLLAYLNDQPRASVNAIDVAVLNGTVTLSGVITDDGQREALRMAAKNIPGVKKVEDRLAWLIPGTGLVGELPVIVGPVL